ncbi:hypothetical protein HDV63DRAFT_374556 [Trichoderma sp. SZMC 28014]
MCLLKHLDTTPDQILSLCCNIILILSLLNSVSISLVLRTRTVYHKPSTQAISFPRDNSSRRPRSGQMALRLPFLPLPRLFLLMITPMRAPRIVLVTHTCTSHWQQQVQLPFAHAETRLRPMPPTTTATANTCTIRENTLCFECVKLVVLIYEKPVHLCSKKEVSVGGVT